MDMISCEHKTTAYTYILNENDLSNPKPKEYSKEEPSSSLLKIYKAQQEQQEVTEQEGTLAHFLAALNATPVR